MEERKVREEMQALIDRLLPAARAYYQESRELMSNFEYDSAYDRLQKLEEESGIVLSGSPTQRVGYEVVSSLPKITHEKPMLSLDKTKSVDELIAWLGAEKALLSWKMDGLTIVLRYRNGELYQAVTRGNGYIGELVTNNVRAFRNVPLRIPYQGELLLRGEALMRYSDFDRINRELPDTDAKYKNPRNLCTGTVRQLDPAVTAARGVYFHAFSLVEAEGVDFNNSRAAQFAWLRDQGFEVVEFETVTADTLREAVARFEAKIPENDFPSDGLVLLLDDIAYGDSLGRTAKFPRNAIAFKWQDEQAETVLREIEWSPSRTGLINPVAIFDPVDLEGTEVRRASVHNVSVLRSLKLGLGDHILVYKANMIIPQIAENLTKSDTAEPPAHCPVCGTATERRKENDAETLYCVNPDCAIKRVKRFALMTSRDAFHIDGLSETTLEKLIQEGFIHRYADLFHLKRAEAAIAAMKGFGETSAAKLIEAAEKARHLPLSRFVYGLGIPGVGVQNAKVLSKAFQGDIQALLTADVETLTGIDGIGEVMAADIVTFFRDPKEREIIDELLQEVTLEPEASTGAEAQRYAGQTYVITGSLVNFPNRTALKDYITARGGKVAGEVSAKTTALINNDITSGSSKNKKARELGIPILSEAEFLAAEL